MVLSWWPLACAASMPEKLSVPGALVLDDVSPPDEETLHLQWRRWLQLFNTLQTLPGLVMTTVAGITAADCEMLRPATGQPAGPAGTSDQGALAQEWLDVLGLTLEQLRPGLRQLAMNGAPAPIVGHELADQRGVVVAEAELAWLSVHGVVLTFEQADLADAWRAAGWRVLVLDENVATIAGTGWVDAVSEMLGINNVGQGGSV